MNLFQSRLERQIADLFGFENAILFGRARSGIAALLDILDLSSAPFVMPSNICPGLLLAVHACGAKAVLARVEASNGLPSDSTYVEMMKREAFPGVVMPTHLYGFVQDYSETLVEAKARGWFVLENDTIATRARIAGAGRTALGDALVVSFGYAKAIEAGGGGAILTDDASLANELRIRAKGYPTLDDEAIRAEEDFMLLTRRLRNEGVQGSDMEKTLLDRVPDSCYRFPESLEEPLFFALEGFENNISARRHRVEVWDRCLAPVDDILFAPQAECIIPWRLIRRAPGIRDKIVAALRAEGVDAGSNFPPLFRSFPILLEGQEYEGAEQWGRDVLNLWVTPQYDDERIHEVSQIIINIVSR